jgi:hypothetical protein
MPGVAERDSAIPRAECRFLSFGYEGLITCSW